MLSRRGEARTISQRAPCNPLGLKNLWIWRNVQGGRLGVDWDFSPSCPAKRTHAGLGVSPLGLGSWNDPQGETPLRRPVVGVFAFFHMLRALVGKGLPERTRSNEVDGDSAGFGFSLERLNSPRNLSCGSGPGFQHHPSRCELITPLRTALA